MRKWIHLSLSTLLLGCSATAPVSVTNPPAQGDIAWPQATLEARGFDIDKMRRLSDKLDSGGHPNTHIVLVEYDGALVYEKYLAGEDESWGTPLGFREFDVDSRHDLRSISKSVTALLLGIALGDDYAVALERPVIEYFPEFADRVAPGVEKITLHQVLTMSSGFEWNEMDLSYSKLANDARQMYQYGDAIEYVLAKPLRDEPGQAWYYNGGNTMILAAVVEAVSGKPFLEFAQTALFDPLGIEIADYEWKGEGIFWKRDPRFPSAASGLRMRGRDLAKIGSLMLHQGRWQGRQVVPREWVRLSSQRHMEQTYSTWSMGGVFGYGYQWWHGRFREYWGSLDAIVGVGYGGQRVYIVPEKKLVVTIFGANYRSGFFRVSQNVFAEIIAAAP